jgi:hypothetical protein
MATTLFAIGSVVELAREVGDACWRAGVDVGKLHPVRTMSNGRRTPNIDAERSPTKER